MRALVSIPLAFALTLGTAVGQPRDWCGTDTVPPYSVESLSADTKAVLAAPQVDGGAQGIVRTIRLGITVDGELTQTLGSRGATKAWVERVVAISSPLWERSFATNLVIEELVIFEDPATDPFEAVSGACARYEHDNWWHQHGLPEVDALIFVSGRNDVEIGGIASGFIGFPMHQLTIHENLCPNGEMAGEVVWTGPSVALFYLPGPPDGGPLSWARHIFQHELGHVAGANHSHDTCFEADDPPVADGSTPVDQCETSILCGTTTTLPTPADGAVHMSYCGHMNCAESFGEEGRHGHRSERVRDRMALLLEANHNLLQPVEVPPEPCDALGDALFLQGGRFRVDVCWRVPAQGTSGVGKVVPGADDLGAFYFFNVDNPELYVKVRNACAPPFHRFWFFAAGLTNVEVTVTVTDTETGLSKTYFNPAGRAFESVQDTDTFDVCP